MTQAECLYQTMLGGISHTGLGILSFWEARLQGIRATETDATSMSRDCEILIFAPVSLAVTCMREGRDSNNTAVLTATPRKEREGSDSCKRGGLPTFFLATRWCGA